MRVVQWLTVWNEKSLSGGVQILGNSPPSYGLNNRKILGCSALVGSQWRRRATQFKTICSPGEVHTICMNDYKVHYGMGA